MKTLIQPTIAQVRDYFRALPKRAYGATTGDTCRCIVAAPIAALNPDLLIAIQPGDKDDGTIEADVIHTTEFTTVPLNDDLNRLAIAFDHMDAGWENVTAGACVRIVERFAKKEGIAL